jgi:hypothetical protein
MNTDVKTETRNKAGQLLTSEEIEAKESIAAEVETNKDLAPATKQESMADHLISLAIDKDLDMDKLERLIKMRDEEEMKTARSFFNAAMARVQKIIQPIIADADNDNIPGSRYAKLATIVGTLSPIYAEEGFSVSYGTDDCGSEKLTAEGWFRTTAELSHAGGYSKKYFIDLPLDIVGMAGKINKTKIHGTKSTLTYARGILMGLMFNFTTKMDVDNDGNQAGDTIPEEQAATLRDEIAALEGDEAFFCDWLKPGAKKLEDLPVSLLPKAQKAINEQKATAK